MDNEKDHLCCHSEEVFVIFNKYVLIAFVLDLFRLILISFHYGGKVRVIRGHL